MNNSKIVNAIEKIYLLLMINICFFLTTLPLMIAFVMLKPELIALPFFLLASIPLGPTLFATSQCLIEVAKRKEISIFNVFFKNWLVQFKKSLTITCLVALIIIIGIVDIHFFSQTIFLKWINPLIIVLIIITIMIYSNIIFLQTKQNFTIKKLVRIGIFYVFKQLLISVVNALLLTMLILLMIIKPALGFLLFPSLLISLLLWNSQKFLDINLS